MHFRKNFGGMIHVIYHGFSAKLMCVALAIICCISNKLILIWHWILLKSLFKRVLHQRVLIIKRLPSKSSTVLIKYIFAYKYTYHSSNKQRVLMHGHQGWNVRHGLCHIYMIYVYTGIWVVYSFCLFCCLFIIVTTQSVALYKPCEPKPKFP